MIGLEDIAAISSPEEGRAVALAIRHACGCEHPACDLCKYDEANVALLKTVKGGAG